MFGKILASENHPLGTRASIEYNEDEYAFTYFQNADKFRSAYF